MFSRNIASVFDPKLANSGKIIFKIGIKMENITKKLQSLVPG